MARVAPRLHFVWSGFFEMLCEAVDGEPGVGIYVVHIFEFMLNSRRCGSMRCFVMRSVVKGYHEGMVPRSLDCYQWEAQLTFSSTKWVLFYDKVRCKIFFLSSSKVYYSTCKKFSNNRVPVYRHSNTVSISCVQRAPRSMYQLPFIVDYGQEHPS